MNIWEILGIEPTKEKSIIKNAFAQKSKACHPEEDPDGFMQLRQAFKSAMKLAESKSFTPKGTMNPNHVIGAKQQAKGQPQPKEPIVSPNHAQSQPYKPILFPSLKVEPEELQEKQGPIKNEKIDFGSVSGQTGAALSEKTVVQINQLYGKAERIYKSRVKRDSHSAWKRFFKSHEFHALKTNAYFTKKLLFFILNNHDFGIAIWKKTLLPNLKEWQYEWNGTEIGNYFAIVLDLQMSKRRSKLYGARFVYIFILLPIISILSGVIIILLSDTTNDQMRTETMQTTPVEYPKLADVLPVTASELEQIEQEQKELSDLADAICEGIPFSQVELLAQKYGLLEVDYQSFREYFLENNTIGSMVRAYAVIEPEIVRDKIIPIVREYIVSGTESQYTFPCIGSLYLVQDRYDTLIDAYENGGEEALDAALAEYKFFSFSVERLRVIEYDEGFKIMMII